jgi:hypothetical protein
LSEPRAQFTKEKKSMSYRLKLKIKIESMAAERRIIRRAVKQMVAGRRRDQALRRKHYHEVRENRGEEFTRAEFFGVVGERVSVTFRRLDEKTVNEIAAHGRDLGEKARAAHLAANFLRGTAYSAAENNPYSIPDFELVEKNIKRFSEENAEQSIRMIGWFREAGEHLLSLAKDKENHGGMPAAVWTLQVRAALRSVGVMIEAKPIPVSVPEKILAD